MTLGQAKSILSDRGLHGTVTYKTTGQYPSGTVISQSRKAGTSTRPGSVVTLVVAKAPPPSPTAPPPTAPPPTAPPKNCDPAYPDKCLQDGIGDWDCANGSGNGPNYVDGPLTVLAPDPFDLDRNHDGVGCEEG
jgi:PASTA domain